MIVTRKTTKTPKSKVRNESCKISRARRPHSTTIKDLRTFHRTLDDADLTLRLPTYRWMAWESRVHPHWEAQDQRPGREHYWPRKFLEQRRDSSSFGRRETTRLPDSSWGTDDTNPTRSIFLAWPTRCVWNDFENGFFNRWHVIIHSSRDHIYNSYSYDTWIFCWNNRFLTSLAFGYIEDLESNLFMISLQKNFKTW